MFAVLAVIAFAIAFIMQITTGTAAHIADAEIIGFICLAAHMVWGIYPWRH
jgi:hypothetical protein